MSAGDPNCTYRAEDAKDGLQLFTNIVDGPLTLVVIVLGSIGNVHCVSVVCSRQLNRVMAANLAALAFWDLLLLVSAFGYYSLEAGVRLTGINMQFNRLTVSLHGLVAIANTASTWLVISVTTQRFRAVLQPFQCSNEDRLIGHHPQNFGRYHRKSAFRRTLYSMRIPMLVMLMALLVNLPTFFELRVRRCQSFDGSLMNITDAQEIYPTTMRLDRKYQIYYRIAFNTLAKTFGPLIVIGALSVATLVGMHRAVSERGIILVQQRRPSVYRADTDKERCIQMVTLLLLMKFMALRCWPTVLDAWEVFGKPNSSKTGVILFKYLIKLSNLLVVTNSATNCLVYILVKRAFQRRQLRRLTLEQFILIYLHRRVRQLASVTRVIGRRYPLRPSPLNAVVAVRQLVYCVAVGEQQRSMASVVSLFNCSLRAEDVSAGVRLFDDIVGGPVTTAVIVLGVVGNAKSIQLLTRTRMNAAMASSLIALAVWDITLLVSSLGYYSLAASMHLLVGRNWTLNHLSVLLHGAVALANTTSTWLLIEVTVRRFFAVARPFDSATTAVVETRTEMGRWSMLRAVCVSIRVPVLLTFCALIVSIPVFFELEVVDCWDVGAEIISQQIAPSDLRLHPLYKVYYRAILSTALKTVGPFVLISALTVATVIGMRRSFARRKAILVEQRQASLFESDLDKKHSLQCISMILLCKFIVLRCWPIVLDVWEAATEPAQRSDFPLFAYLVGMSNLLVIFNSASNCVVFVFVKRAFETRRNRRTRHTHILRFAQHADQFFLISRRMAADEPEPNR